MSRVRTVARWDLRRALRDRLVWGATGLLGAMFLPSTASIASSGHRTLGEMLLLLPLDLVTFVLVVVAAVGYDSVAGERETGTARTLLGLGGTRRDLVVGTFLSRAAVATLAVAVVLTVASAFVARGYGAGSLVPFWVMAGWMLVYGVVWTAVTVGYSAAFESGYRTLAALVGTYAVFSPSLDVWGTLVRPALALAFTGSPSSPAHDGLASAPLWFRLAERLNPLTGVVRAMRWSVRSAGPGAPVGDAAVNLFGAAVFLCFGAAGLLVGARRFERADLRHGGDGSWLRRRLRRVGAAVAVPRLRSGSAGAVSRPLTVARAGLRHALQDGVVLVGAALFTSLVVPQVWSSLDPGSVATAGEQVRGIAGTFALPTLVLGAAAGYGAVAGEREAGTARTVLASGASRRDVVLGALGARLTAVCLALAPSVVVVELLVTARFGDPFPRASLAWAGWVLVTALVWTTFVVGASAAVSSRYRTLAAVCGTYLLFGTDVGLWDPVVRPAVSLLFTGRPASHESYVYAAGGGPAWFRFTDHLNPLVSLRTVRESFFAVAGHGGGTTASPATVLFAAAVPLLFATTTLIVGVRRFERADL